MPPIVTSRAELSYLVEKYDCWLLDAFGVLVDSGGPLAGAAELLAYLRAEGRRFYLLTNDASRLPEAWADRLSGLGVCARAEDVITSGSLIARHFGEQGLAGARCVVLGTEDSRRYVSEAGGVVVDARAGSAEAVVVCDDDGYEFLPTIEAVLSMVFARIDARQRIHLVLPNPDLIHPRSVGRYGFTAGSVALLLESGIRARYGPRRGAAYRFVGLGKPFAPIYAEAERRSGTRNLVMVGDQLSTDIRGANDYGIDSVLVAGGVSALDEALDASEPGAKATAVPTYQLPALRELFG